MSLHIRLTEFKPTEVYSDNITHNLGKMASEVKLSNDVTLYNVLWRPDECDPPLHKASDVAEYLDQAFNLLLAEPEKYIKFNPENGWGSYDGLVKLVHDYRNACWNNPMADIEVCR
jgi:hypothetical protein